MNLKPFYAEENFEIYHGDCREILTELLLAGKLDGLALTLTDPPFGINSVHKSDGKMGGSVAAPNQVYAPVIDDDKPMDVAHLMNLPGRKIIWGMDHNIHGIPYGGRLLVWDKRDGMKSNDFSDNEIAWDSVPGARRTFRHRQVGMLHDGYGDIKRIHPNQKPLALMLWCLSFLDDDEEGTRPLILDPYMGSGTSLRAAKDAGCRAIGIEMSEEYCKIAAERLAQQTIFEALDQIKKLKQDKFDFGDGDNGNGTGDGQEAQPAPTSEPGDAGDSPGRLRDTDGEGRVLHRQLAGDPAGGARQDADARPGQVLDDPLGKRTESLW